MGGGGCLGCLDAGARSGPEAVQVEYDPSRVSYSQLLDVFWKGGSFRSPSYSAQYKSAVWW